MKIAILRRTYITRLDGVNNFIFSLAHGLESLGHTVQVITWGFQEVERPNDLSKWALEIYGVESEILSLNDKPSEGSPWARIGWDWLTKGSRLLKELNPAAVIINGIVPLKFHGRKIAVNHGIYEMQSNKLNKMIAKNLYKSCIRVCVSNKLSKEYLDFFGLDHEVISLPLRLSMFRSLKLDERDDAVLHIGTRSVKNLKTSIEAIRILRKKGVQLRLIVVGALNSDTESLVKEARQCGVDIETKYGIPNKELVNLYGKAKMLLLPSKYEALSYVTLEAMASGTPVVVSKEIPSDVVYNGYNGFRINTYNPADYAEALAVLLKNQELWTKLSKNAISSVSRFNHMGIAEKYIELIVRDSSITD